MLIVFMKVVCPSVLVVVVLLHQFHAVMLLMLHAVGPVYIDY